MEHTFRCSCGNLSKEAVCPVCGKDSSNIRLTVSEVVKYYQPFIGTYSNLSNTIVRRNLNAYIAKHGIQVVQNDMRYINGGYAYTYPLWLVTEAMEDYKTRISTLIRIPPHLR